MLFSRVLCCFVLLLLKPFGANAFCFENALDSFHVYVEQISNYTGLKDVAFRKEIQAGGKECCNFHNLDCNQNSSDNDVMTSFLTSVVDPTTGYRYPDTLLEIQVPSGGFCRFSGDPHHATVEVYNANGQQIHPQMILHNL
ncbi:hypothetical protein DM01DRAFT_1377298 [Hesseltinella vesiculosa]|uniref:Uncharacterized protein n=1 Tax=Hesseltinella vesiculosa TaxID=101127 RepID=A0A1X2G8U7_9FUNG|nr:hypothetical protein DM01DRAFT_1377298 [Hesseltinella vesiculosa]